MKIKILIITSWSLRFILHGQGALLGLVNYLVLWPCRTNHFIWDWVHTWTANFIWVYDGVALFRLLIDRIGEFSRTDTFTCGGSFRRTL
jgi:hypothetical protein